MYAIIKRCKIVAKIAVEEGELERAKQTERERGGSVPTRLEGGTERWRTAGR